LHSIVEKFQGQGKAAAQDYISNLTTSHRFQRDVWIS
jgi:sulfite reductase alpha subunit-like flavoprotein